MTTFNRIKETADSKGLSLRKVAELSGLGETSIYGWKKKQPAAQSLQKVADTLNVSVDYLLGTTDQKKSDNTHANWSDDDLNTAIDNAQAYNGRPINEHDKKVIKNLLTAWLDSDED